MTVEPSLLKRRRLSPEKLRAARLRAGFSSIADVVRRLDFGRLGYARWEATHDRHGNALQGLTHFDYVAFENVCRLFGVSYEQVTDPLDGADEEEVAPAGEPQGESPADSPQADVTELLQENNRLLTQIRDYLTSRDNLRFTPSGELERGSLPVQPAAAPGVQRDA